MKRLFVVMVASMAMSYAMAQCAQTGSKEGCKSKCEQRKECGKQEKASDDCGKCDKVKCEKKESMKECGKQEKNCTTKTDMMVKMLDLTPEQAEKLNVLFEKYHNFPVNCTGRKYHSDKKCEEKCSTSECDKQAAEKSCNVEQKCAKTPSRDEMESLKEIEKAFEAELKTILNAEQFAKYESCKNGSKCKHKK